MRFSCRGDFLGVRQWSCEYIHILKDARDLVCLLAPLPPLCISDLERWDCAPLKERGYKGKGGRGRGSIKENTEAACMQCELLCILLCF